MITTYRPNRYELNKIITESLEKGTPIYITTGDKKRLKDTLKFLDDEIGLTVSSKIKLIDRPEGYRGGILLVHAGGASKWPENIENFEEKIILA